jgi:hypothetical protein
MRPGHSRLEDLLFNCHVPALFWRACSLRRGRVRRYVDETTQVAMDRAVDTDR